MSTQEERDAQDTRSREGLAERVQATFDAELALVNETKLKFFNETLELKAEIKRLTEALAAANADRDRLAQQLGIAQTETRGLRLELNRLGAPHAGYSYGDPLE